MYRSRFATVSFSLLAATAQAQDHVHPSADKLGTVHFQTSCTTAVAPAFDRGIAWLHSFEFAAAIRSFEEVLKADPDCAMAHWGIALSRWTNPMSVANRSPAQLQRGRAAIEAAKAISNHRITQREKGYIAAAAELYENFEKVSQAERVGSYERAMAKLASDNPNDEEAQIFHAISLVAAASPSDKTYTNQKKAGAKLEAMWEKQPDHPGLAHYIIHTYDYPALAGEASRAARRYAMIAPSAAHALHMPSHIFTRTGMWKESIETNLRSRDIAEKTASIAEALHALDYAAYAYLQLQRHADARRVLDQLPALEAKFDVNAITGAAPGSAGVFALAAIPARYALERNAWGEAASLQPKRSDFPWTDAMTWFARALGSARSGNPAATTIAVDSLESIHGRLAGKDEPYWTEQVAIQHLAAQAWLDLAEGRADSALSRMKRAAAREDATEKSAVTPGPLAPARELLGDMLMELGKPAEALAEYQKTLQKEPNRYRALAGGVRAAAATGNTAAEQELLAKLAALQS